MLPYANWAVNAASFNLGPVAPGAIVSLFAQAIASDTSVVDALPLPETLDGVSVLITDSAGVERAAPLYFVSPSQVNVYLPEELALGRATVALTRQDGSSVSGDLLVRMAGPGLFTANVTGQGVGLFSALRADENGVQTDLPVFAYDQNSQTFTPVPISLGAATDQVYLILYATGVRGRSGLEEFVVEIDGDEVPVAYAGPQSEFIGLDQINVGPLPAGLAGAGEVEVEVVADDVRSAPVVIAFE